MHPFGESCSPQVVSQYIARSTICTIPYCTGRIKFVKTCMHVVHTYVPVPVPIVLEWTVVLLSMLGVCSVPSRLVQDNRCFN